MTRFYLKAACLAKTSDRFQRLLSQALGRRLMALDRAYTSVDGVSPVIASVALPVKDKTFFVFKPFYQLFRSPHRRYRLWHFLND
jgi:hypothetical protein